MRVLIVADEPKLSTDLKRVLTSAGFVPEIADDGETAWFLGDTEDYAAIILDLGLPKMDGMTILKNWRDGGLETPVLILTARGSWSERVAGIDAGADDYLAKPFQMEELIARLHAILRRSAGKTTSSITIGTVTLDARQMRATVDGVPLTLSQLEYRALTYLMYHAGNVVAPHELNEHVYGVGAQRETNTLEVLIGRLRKKLAVPLIETRRGHGYIVTDESE